MFINSSISLHQESERGRIKENAAAFDANGVPTEQTVKGIIDTNLQQARQKGADTMIGRSTVCEKVIVHPTSGQKIALCVRMWSFGQYDAMKRIIERRQPDPVPAQPSAPCAAESSRDITTSASSSAAIRASWRRSGSSVRSACLKASDPARVFRPRVHRRQESALPA